MEENITNRPVVKKLPRGSFFLPNTSAGKIQVFIAIESIKDTKSTVWGVADYYIAPDNFLSISNDLINTCAIEFPGYNRFLTNNKIVIVCTRAQDRLMKENMELSLYPETDEFKIDLSGFYNNESLVPRLSLESEFLGGKPSVDFLFNFQYFDENNTAVIQKKEQDGSVTGEVKISKIGLNLVQIYDVTADVDYGEFSLDYTPPKKIAHKSKSTIKKYCKENNIEITYGNSLYEKVLILSSSSGFDVIDDNINPKHRWGSTTGVAFFDYFGNIVLVDPPFNTIYRLLDEGINLECISAIIITHLHEDHDGGFFQTVMNLPMKVPVYMTYYNMLKEVRKICNNLNSDKSETDIKFTDDEIKNMIDFQIIDMKDAIKITEDYSFEFFHTWHSVEAVGFYVKNRSGNYVSYWSGDTQLSEILLKKAVKNGIMTRQRMEHLSNLKRCLHYFIEISAPDYLHNSRETVMQIIKKNSIDPSCVTVIHCTEDPGIQGVNLAIPGMTIDLTDKSVKEKEDPMRIVKETSNLVNSIPFLARIFKDSKSMNIIFQNLEIADNFKNGDIIFKKGDPADYTLFYLDGGAGHIVMDRELEKEEFPKVIEALNRHVEYPGLVAHRYERGTVLGEAIATKNRKRTKYVYAVGRPRYLKLSGSAWEKIANSNTPSGHLLRRILNMRNQGIPFALGLSPIFTGVELPVIEELLTEKGKVEKWKKGTYLISQHQSLDHVYLIINGKVKITQKKVEKDKLVEPEIVLNPGIEIRQGSSSLFVGEMSLLEKIHGSKNQMALPKANVIVESDEIDVIAINCKDILEFTKTNPRLEFNLHLLALMRREENRQTIDNIMEKMSIEPVIDLENVTGEVVQLNYDESTGTYDFRSEIGELEGIIYSDDES